MHSCNAYPLSYEHEIKGEAKREMKRFQGALLPGLPVVGFMTKTSRMIQSAASLVGYIHVTLSFHVHIHKTYCYEQLVLF